MILNSDAINDSKKISELRKLNHVTKHQENTWFPIAQYNSRTNTYTNAAINLQAITSYNMAYTSYALDNVLGEEWLDLMAITYATTQEELKSYIHKSSIAENIVGYAFGYAMTALDWQVI